MRRVWLLVLVALLVSIVVLPAVYFLNQAETGSTSSDFFFGVSFGGTTVNQAKLLIDKVKGYTNFFVVNSWEINGAANETLHQACSSWSADETASRGWFSGRFRPAADFSIMGQWQALAIGVERLR